MQLTATIAATIVGFSSICSGLAIPAAADQANHEVAKRVCTPYWACRVPPPKPKLTVVPIPDIRVIPIEDRSTTTEGRTVTIHPTTTVVVTVPSTTITPTITIKPSSTPQVVIPTSGLTFSSSLNLGPLVPPPATTQAPVETIIDIPTAGLTFSSTLKLGPLVPA